MTLLWIMILYRQISPLSGQGQVSICKLSPVGKNYCLSKCTIIISQNHHYTRSFMRKVILIKAPLSCHHSCQVSIKMAPFVRMVVSCLVLGKLLVVKKILIDSFFKQKDMLISVIKIEIEVLSNQP